MEGGRARRVSFRARCVQLLILTGQRREEVAGARRREFKEQGTLWTIPAERVKNGNAQDVPLTGTIQGILGALPRIGSKSEYLFSTTGVGPVSGHSNAKEQLDATMLAIAREEAEARGENPDDAKLEPWRLHDLRRTAASGMARLGIAVHVIEAVLNHKSGQVSGVAAVYNRHSYLPKKDAPLMRGPARPVARGRSGGGQCRGAEGVAMGGKASWNAYGVWRSQCIVPQPNSSGSRNSTDSSGRRPIRN